MPIRADHRVRVSGWTDLRITFPEFGNTSSEVRFLGVFSPFPHPEVRNPSYPTDALSRAFLSNLGQARTSEAAGGHAAVKRSGRGRLIAGR